MEESKKSDTAAQRLMESVSLELDTELRLHAHRLDLGKAEMLTDAILLPFTDIEQRLARYTRGSSKEEKEQLSKSMRSYLSRLNSNPLLPLHFRLKVLNKFEKELDLFDAEMTGAMLNTYKIGVELVQKAARTEPGYYSTLVHMVGNAIELAVKLLKLSLEEYHAPSVLATRQVFELARLGLNVLPALPEEERAEATRLRRAIANHELLRSLNFFGKSKDLQKTTWLQMQRYIDELQPTFIRKDDPLPDMPDQLVMLSNTSRPNSPAQVMLLSNAGDPAKTDTILLPLGGFVEKLVAEIRHCRQVLEDTESQKHELHTEESLRIAIAGGMAIMDALRSKQRQAERFSKAGTRVLLNTNLDKAFVEYHAAVVMDDYDYAPSIKPDSKPWSVIDVSELGTGIENMHGETVQLEIGSLIGLSWVPHDKEPMLGIIRWIRHPKRNEQRIGIEFLKEEYKLAKGIKMQSGQKEFTDKRSWPLLVKPGKQFLTIVFPDTHVFKNMPFKITIDGKNAYLKISDITTVGPNYSICRAVLAKELG